MLNSIIEKRSLSVNEIENQMAFELPDRETLGGARVVLACLQAAVVGVQACLGEIQIEVEDVNVATQICAQVVGIGLKCTITQH
jgi:Mg/Co/Ni transporter MgtE